LPEIKGIDINILNEECRMQKNLLKILIPILSLVFLFSCAGPQTSLTFQASQFPAAGYQPNVDNFMVLFDSSSSMGNTYKGHEKLAIAKAVAGSMNQTLPELNFSSGMRTFGHYSGVTREPTVLVYGLTRYSTARLGSAIDGVTHAGGTTPLGSAIAGAHEDFRGVSGKTALIIVSDGKDLLHNPKAEMEVMAADYGDRLCVYTIQIGDDSAGAKSLEQLTTVTGCGFASTADSLTSGNNMADFVEKVFLSPAPIQVAEPEPFVDSDGDGVADHLDKCPGTPKGATVDAEGCWIIGTIHFDFDEAEIKSDAIPVLNEIGDVMQKNPGLNMNVNGFTDNIGTLEYNQRLSERRAQAAKNYLVDRKLGIERFTINGFAYTMPVSSNETEEGRRMNRRVEFTPFE
jgi:OmpA-OmpF porin, OOP family